MSAAVGVILPHWRQMEEWVSMDEPCVRVCVFVRMDAVEMARQKYKAENEKS